MKAMKGQLVMRSDTLPRHRSSRKRPNARWAALMGDDVAGIDGDIERLIAVYVVKLGCTREKASAALVRELSSLGLGRGALQLEEQC